MNKLQRLELLKDFIQEAVDRGATSIEEIHQYIADLPFEAFEKSGLLKADTLGLRTLSRRSIGLVYGAVRRINQGIGQLISDQIENIEETQEVSELLREHALKPAGGKTAAVNPPTEPQLAVLRTAKKAATRSVAEKPKASKPAARKAAAAKKPVVRKTPAKKRGKS